MSRILKVFNRVVFPFDEYLSNDIHTNLHVCVIHTCARTSVSVW